MTNQARGIIIKDLANTSNTALGDALLGVKLSAAGSIARTQHDKNSEQLWASDFGLAIGATPAVNTAALNAAIVYANSLGGGSVILPAGTFTLASAGVISTRNYGINLLSNAHLIGQGAGITVLKAANATNMDVITTPRTTTFSNVGLFDLTVDGNQANQTTDGFNIWIYNGDGFYFDNLHSNQSRLWSIRIDAVTNVIGGEYRCKTPTSVASAGDGLHIKDSSYIAISRILINEASDDGFIIEASLADCHDIAVGELVVTSNGAGLLLFCDDTVAASNKNIYNIQLPSVTTNTCAADALTMTTANFYNVNINLVDIGSRAAASLVAGSTLFNGGFRDCDFKISSRNPTTQGFGCTTTNGNFFHNKIDLKVYNPADGNIGANIKGNYWTGSISIDYDPLANKASPSIGFDMWGTNSVLTVDAIKGLYCIQIRGSANGNTINLGAISGGTTKDLNINSTADNNTFIGGSLTSYVDSGGATKFYGVRGCENYGVTSCSPNGSGNANIPHGLIGTPNYANISLRGNNLNSVNVQSIDATNIVVYVHTSSAAITAGSFLVDWNAKI